MNKLTYTLFALIIGFVALHPTMVHAFSVIEILDMAQGWVDALIVLAASLALLFFFYGLAKYILSDTAGKDEGKNIMIRGIVGMFVIASIWGIIAFIGVTLGIGQGGTLTPPLLDPNCYEVDGTPNENCSTSKVQSINNNSPQ